MATAIALRFKVKKSNAATIESCRLIKSFSSSGPNTQDEENVTESSQPLQISKHIPVANDLRFRLQQSQNRSAYSSRFSIQNSNIASSLSEFRQKTAAPLPKGADISLEEIYNRNVISDSPVISTPRLSEPKNRNQNLPKTIFGSESGKADKDTVLCYSPKDLGERLKKLRPEEAKGSDKSFSLVELNKRLMKLRELDRTQPDKEAKTFSILRRGLISVEKNIDPSTITQGVSVNMDFRTPNYLKKPPKDDLVEKYFHPDNMSSAEKMKLELQKVRDEFKMSKSDCGSSRVQVATLTTKIKHLSANLHKKDKHSRKGLLAMVQKRKKLLKYMRRTDWDSYCLVLANLGLRDNPDYKS